MKSGVPIAKKFYLILWDLNHLSWFISQKASINLSDTATKIVYNTIVKNKAKNWNDIRRQKA